MSGTAPTENVFRAVYSIADYVHFLEKSEKNGYKILSRVGVIALPFFELHGALLYCGSAAVRLPGLCIKLIISPMIGPDRTNTDSKFPLVLIYQDLPHATDVLIMIGKAAFCILGIAFSSAFGLIDPALNARIHRLAGFTLTPTPPAPPPKKEEKEDFSKLRGFDDVVGFDELKEETQNITDIIQNPEDAKSFEVSMPNGLLLDGPPGCGKTYFATKITEELSKKLNKKVAFHQISGGGLSSFVGQSAIIIKETFVKAKIDAIINNSISVLFIDELDKVVPRSSQMGGTGSGAENEFSRILSEFLLQLNNAGESHVLVIGATNEPKNINEAVIREGRFDRKFNIGLPDPQTRRKLLEHYIGKRKHDKNLNLQALASVLKDHSIAAIKTKVEQASKEAFKLFREAKKAGKSVEDIGITDEILMKSFGVKYELCPEEIDLM